ncbi:solute carrier family 66 member 2-like [Rhopilema esculentum]|uniref:solute carrier family 66 member 2-like n=1 Tax=Rhopilema esculentum TaxID=499914 RepID=UPI0031D4A611
MEKKDTLFNKVSRSVQSIENGHLIPEFSSLNIISLVSFAASAAMVFGGVVPYIPQYYDIYKTRNTDGFSTHVCLALLVANVLRILFWYGHPFELPLLAQSIIMTFAMLVLLELCTRIKRESEMSAKRRYIWNLEYANFWNWTNFRDYLQFLFLFILFGASLTYLLLDVKVFLETLGFVSVFTEAMLGAPQFYRNFQNKSTEGMSIKMVAMWFCGDTFKTGYFIVKQAPIQFGICGMLQVTIDIAILYQVYHYKNQKSSKIHNVKD